jgi:hypothetical protein
MPADVPASAILFQMRSDSAGCKFKSVFARVAGSRDQGGNAVHVAAREPVVPDGGQVHVAQRLQNADRLRPLNGELRIRVADIFHLAVELRSLPGDPGEILVAVGGVDAKEIVVGRQAMDEDVVHEGSPRREQAGILRLAVLKFCGVVAAHALNEVKRLRAAQFDFAHMRHIEDAGARSHGQMFFDRSRRVLHGQVPAAEINHFAAGSPMHVAERGLFQTCS